MPVHIGIFFHAPGRLTLEGFCKQLKDVTCTTKRQTPPSTTLAVRVGNHAWSSVQAAQLPLNPDIVRAEWAKTLREGVLGIWLGFL